MISTRPPRPGEALDTGDGWGLRRTVRARFGQPAHVAADATHAARLDVYVGDMLRPYGLVLAPGAHGHGRGQSYGEMAEALLERVLGPGDAVDLLVLVYAIPDITPGRATAVYLSHVCPGRPMAFAICDQGAAGAFTGLRLIREYAAGGFRRALLIVVEQGELAYDPGVPVDVPAGHTAVALLFGDSSASPTGTEADAARAGLASVHNRAGVDADEVLAALAAEVKACGEDVTLILGSSGSNPIDPRIAASSGLSDVDVQAAPAGQPYTGVWWALAEQMEQPRPRRRVMLANYDGELRYLSLATFDLSPVRPATTDVTGADLTATR